MYNRFRLPVGRKYVLVQPLVHTLQHRVVVCILIFHREILFDAGNAVQSHVLGDFHGVGTPGSNHLAARADEMSFQVVFTFGGGFSKKPAEFVAVCLGEFVVTFYGNHALGWCSEKKNHTYIYEFTIYDFTIEVTSLSIFIFSSWGDKDTQNRWGGEKKENKKRMQFYLACVFLFCFIKPECVLLYDDFIRK